MPRAITREQALLETIARVIADETGAARPPRLRRETRAGQIPGWDSLTHFRILVGIEDSLRIRIDIDRTFEFGDVGELVDYLSELASVHD
jgi:acyl carrier protein